MSISDDITTLRKDGVPDAELIHATAPDFQSNRIVVRVGAASTSLFAELARRYGTDAIAVWIDPDFRGASTLSRNADYPQFYGGASIGTPGHGCTDAFSWTIGAANGNALVTAAHCISSGGNVTIGTSSTVRGTVAVSSEENWNDNTGTQFYSGQTTYRGDVALIRLKSSYTSLPRMYRGGPTSTTWSTVVTRLGRYSYTLESVWAGGSATGETGPYQIDFVNMNVWYNQDGPNVVAKNIAMAHPLFSGPPINHGDSGGSVFRENASGNIIAVGVISGHYNDSLVFTDLWHTYLALPGDVNY